LRNCDDWFFRPFILLKIFGFIRRFTESLPLSDRFSQKFPKPQIVLGMGGFTSTAPILATVMSRHFHADSRIERGSGESRIALRRNGAAVLLAKACAPFFPKVRTELTGTPIRDRAQCDWIDNRPEIYGIASGVTTSLVMGGSQARSGINQPSSKSPSSCADSALK